jgi:DNA-binding IclR family transcriptional regulator
MTKHLKTVIAVEAGDVPAVVRAKGILDLVANSPEPPSVSEIARVLTIPKSSVHGLCATLVNLNLLVRHGANAYALGGHLMVWANAFAAKSDMVGSFIRMWEEVPELRADTVTLSTLDGLEVTYIACREGKDPLGLTFRIGMRLPAAFTATGKAMLSTFDNASLESLFEAGVPEPLTRMSVRTVADLLSEIEETRRRGYSVDNGQVREGMICFGAPVHSFASPRAIGGIAISVLEGQLTAETDRKIGDLVRRCGEKLSRALGG